MAKAEKADIGFALIARNAEKTLGPCLASLAPYVKQIVVGVDDLTTDKTANVARRHGAKVFPVHVSDWHECAIHGKVLAQDFAAARNESFHHLDPDLEWHAWIDADDILEGAATLPHLLAKVPEPVIGFWSPYWYAYVVHEDGTRVPNTVFHRERIFRTHVGPNRQSLTWQHRVHEVCVPAIQGPYIQANNLTWLHQHQQHKAEQSAPRNLLLLEIELEEQGDHPQPRTVFYIGNQYFAVGDWANAAEWYERYTRLDKSQHNPYELWQSYVYMSMACERLGDLDSSLQAAFGAIDTLPQHPEPYYRLSQIYALCGDPHKSIYWAREGDGKEDAPFFVFKNPMDRSYNKFMPLADSLIELGDISGAKAALSQAMQAFPDERVREKIAWCDATEKSMKAAQSFAELAPALGAERAIEMYQTLPDAVKKFGRARDLAMNTLRRRRSLSTQPRMLFWAAAGWEPWSPASVNTTGIGGSETALIEIARRFAQAGWQVDVYNGADFLEGEYDGVGYWDLQRLTPDVECDVLVSWRQPNFDLPVKAKQRVLWMHDLHAGDVPEGTFEKWDQVWGVSQWHADMLRNHYGIQAGYVPNGINPERFASATLAALQAHEAGEPAPMFRKVPFQCVYASSPDRGLMRLLDLWPVIKQAEPGATLHIAYGWETAMKMVERGHPSGRSLLDMKQRIEAKIEKLSGITWRGRLPQDELAKLYSESYLWLYPTQFLEVSCISAMEAMAGGAVPVTTACGALPETLSSAGLLVPPPTFSRGYGETWARAAAGLLQDTTKRKQYEARGRARAQELTWDKAFERWKALLGVDVREEVAA